VLLHGVGSPSENPTSAKRPGAKRPQSSHPKALRAAQVEETILGLLRSSPGLRRAAIAKATAAQRSTTDERLKSRQAKGLIERDDASAGRAADEITHLLAPATQCERWIKRSWLTTSAA
jgi:hypothetical protein